MKQLEKQLKDLQQSIALVELLNRPSHTANSFEILIKKIESIQIRMEGDKTHQNPHIHINIGKRTHAASYEIETGKRIVGSETVYRKTVTEWIDDNRVTLLSTWESMQDGRDVTSYVEQLKGA